MELTATQQRVLDDLMNFCHFEKRFSTATCSWVFKLTRAMMRKYKVKAPSRDLARMLETDLMRNGRKSSTVTKYLQALEYWHESLGSPGGPLKLQKPKKTQHRVEYLKESEVLSVLNACALGPSPERDLAIIMVLATTGLRNKELCNLDINDVDIEQRLLMVRDRGAGIKNYQEDTVVMTVECTQVLAEYLRVRPQSDSRALFLTTNQNTRLNNCRFTTSGLLGMVSRTGRRAGLKRKVWPHLFRHTVGTLMASKGINLALVQRQLRHKNINSTMIYITASEEILRQNLDQHFGYTKTTSQTV
ncbi:tyrosine-type recombinase/integrase [Methanocella sp. MCL-LM]|uniref:tyrosine-type recombinase/integrase n=1 Tax=Methanocella sp. MCL-LM TaxID=3412035 RepID=UPI003C754C6E